MANWKHWQIERNEGGVATVWVDVKDQSQNTFSAAVLTELSEVLDDLEQSTSEKVILFRSRKANSFFAGADVKEFTSIKTADQAAEVSAHGQQIFARIEALAANTVAVIRGACMGGGLEFALACNYRVATNASATRIGLPETQLGILPAWGGTQRLPKVVGLLQTIAMILQAQKLNADKAARIGLVDRVYTDENLEAELTKLVSELLTAGSLQKPILRRSWSKWFIDKTKMGRSMAIGATEKKIASQIQQYPALGKALQAIRLSFFDPEKGYEFERNALGELMLTSTCQNLVALFLNQERARSLKTWDVPEEIRDATLERIAILGGGTMGAGIAQVAAKRGLKVILKEINDDCLNAARERIQKSMDKLLARKRMSEADVRKQMEAINFTTQWDAVSQAEVVIEAVPEMMELKKTVFKELSQKCSAETVLASNTSALSVTEIASVVETSERMAGLHFFNPVHSMDLVEVVQAEKSSPETMGKLVMLTRQLGKTPIVVIDSPGFVVNRVLMPYLDEAVLTAVELTARGQDLSQIDRELKKFGMPMGPLELYDQIGIDVAAHVAGSMAVVFGDDSMTSKILQRMTEQGRLGRKSESGFYNYEKSKRAGLTDLKPFLAEIELELPEAPKTALDEFMAPIQQRLILAMVNEAGRCLDEKVVPEAWMIDLAMVFGTGFAPFLGGPLSYAKHFSKDDLLQALEQLAEVYGKRYLPAESLKTL